MTRGSGSDGAPPKYRRLGARGLPRPPDNRRLLRGQVTLWREWRDDSLSLRVAADAAADFQKILDHRSIVLVDPIDAMARLQAARAHALSGDVVKAKSAYSELFALWKDADPDIPVVKKARAEHARLP